MFPSNYGKRERRTYLQSKGQYSDKTRRAAKSHKAYQFVLNLFFYLDFVFMIEFFKATVKSKCNTALFSQFSSDYYI